jgi:penicillin amidase
MRARVHFALRWAGWLGLGAALCAGAAAAALFFLSQGDAPPPRGELTAEGLRGPVTIARDPFGVPHVEAESVDDAFFGLGFAHAQDRLWQMEMLRREASGTLSELFGRATLPRDRLARTLGLRRAAERELEQLPRTVALARPRARGLEPGRHARDRAAAELGALALAELDAAARAPAQQPGRRRVPGVLPGPGGPRPARTHEWPARARSDR